MMQHVQISPDVAALSLLAAERWFTLAQQCISARDAFYVALAGGNTPTQLYQLLTQPALSTRIDWTKVHIFFSDERCVAATHADSNYGMVERALLSHAPIPGEQIHRMQGELPPEQAAKNYATALLQLPVTHSGIPSLDLILLGVGNDGHIASLFPDATLSPEPHNLVTAVHAQHLKQPRISLTLKTINAAQQLFVLVAGAEKATVIGRVINEPQDDLPAQLIAHHPNAYWYLDQAAARFMRSDTREGQR